MSARTPAAYCCNYRISNAPFGVLSYPPSNLPPVREHCDLLIEKEDSWSEETRDIDKG